jgi:hypothetical protein
MPTPDGKLKVVPMGSMNAIGVKRARFTALPGHRRHLTTLGGLKRRMRGSGPKTSIRRMIKGRREADSSRLNV